MEIVTMTSVFLTDRFTIEILDEEEFYNDPLRVSKLKMLKCETKPLSQSQ